MNIITRQTLKVIGDWELQRRDFEGDEYDYIVRAKGKPAVNLYVNDRYNSEIKRTVPKVEYSANTYPMNLEEAAAFVEHAQQALEVATEFQQAIDAAEDN